MPDASVVSICRRLAGTLHRNLAELFHTFAVYLGIVVLVTVVMALALPGLREQALHVHTALVAALASVPAAAADASDAADASGTGATALQDGAEQVHPHQGTKNFLSALGSEQPAEALADAQASAEQIESLRSYIARKYRVAYDATGVLVDTAYSVAHELELDPILLLAVMAIESRYNPFAESHVGAQGLMQIMTSVHQEKFQEYGGDSVALNPVANIRVGARILKDCIDRRGSVSGGLACYVGATGPSDGGYGAKVQAERRRLALAAGIALARDKG